MRKQLLLVLVLFSFCLLLGSSCFARRALSKESPQSLQREQRQLLRFIKRAKKRSNEVEFLASRLQYLQRAMSMNSLIEVQRSSQGLTRRLRDRRLRSLVGAYIASIDGTTTMTNAEKETFLRLTMELETSLGEVRKAGKRLREIAAKLANFIPPPMKRKIMRQITQLMKVNKKKSKLQEEIATLELEAELEMEACRLEPARARKQLRKLRGQLVVAKKKIEMYDAQLELGNALKSAMADSKLTVDERKVLTRHQMAFNQLRHTVDGLNSVRY